MIHEGPRRTTKKTFSRFQDCPSRRATKDHTFVRLHAIWSVREGARGILNTSCFCHTKGLIRMTTEENPGQGHLLANPRRAPTRGAPFYGPTQVMVVDHEMPWGGQQGAPTDCLLSALCPQGRPYLLSSLRVMPWGGQGRPYFSKCLSQFDAIALGKHQGIGVSEKHLYSPHSGWLFWMVAN